MDTLLQNRVVLHVLFWLIIVFASTFLTSLNLGLFRHHLINNLALLPAQLLAAYFLNYYQLPKLVYKKKYTSFIVSGLLSVFVFSVIARLSIIYIAEPFFRTDFQQETLLEIISDPYYLFAVYAPGVYLFPMVMLAIKMTKGHLNEKHQLDILKKEKATTELNFLKAQIHPHFLFNTLNNLYTLTINKSDIAPEVVIKLSEILDYMLYECGDPTVTINKIEKLIQHYIDLEQLRYGDELDLVFEKDIDNAATEVAPLILLPLVENAFKHGASKDLAQPKVHISLRVVGQKLRFNIFNSKSTLIQEPEQRTYKGIGATNIKRRLDLIYPNNYDLNVDEKKDSYTVDLEINL